MLWPRTRLLHLGMTGAAMPGFTPFAMALKTELLTGQLPGHRVLGIRDILVAGQAINVRVFMHSV
jgi:hypothetical protein